MWLEWLVWSLLTLHRSVIGGLVWLYSDYSFSFYITAQVKDVFPIASTTTPGPNWASKEHSTVLPVGSCRRSPGLNGFDLIKMGITWSGLECIPHLWSSHVHWKDSMGEVPKICADEVKILTWACKESFLDPWSLVGTNNYWFKSPFHEPFENCRD